MLGCTLEGNQLRHCAAKPIVQLAIIANTAGRRLATPGLEKPDLLFTACKKHVYCLGRNALPFTPGVLRSRDQASMSRTHYPLIELIGNIHNEHKL